ncbi:hypothetical protein AAMO2058_001286200 [Amorphochlora amoebiformis]|uniref:TFIIS N-terminal domain-containing protein n=1 Tax=Amorphochlora amoebiformis TaxID=1561963 RepID=A0A7S0GVB0_9EUKA|mmetsp:Transcript_19010/g.30228  ORF Transcript_19010/g.30228 Transcript_19010/m.30228 type:complete len:298 (+) Transcript_19010:22-915(+)
MSDEGTERARKEVEAVKEKLRVYTSHIKTPKDAEKRAIKIGRLIKKLENLPMCPSTIEQTLIGKALNTMRSSWTPELKTRAKELLRGWKDLWKNNKSSPGKALFKLRKQSSESSSSPHPSVSRNHIDGFRARKRRRMQLEGKDGCPSLLDICIEQLRSSIHKFGKVNGRIPPDIIVDVLEECSPDQLERLEKKNPYLAEETDALWERHCKARFSDNQIPKEVHSWRVLYSNLKKEREMLIQASKQRLKESRLRKERETKARMKRMIIQEAPAEIQKYRNGRGGKRRKNKLKKVLGRA